MFVLSRDDILYICLSYVACLSLAVFQLVCSLIYDVSMYLHLAAKKPPYTSQSVASYFGKVVWMDPSKFPTLHLRYQANWKTNDWRYGWMTSERGWCSARINTGDANKHARLAFLELTSVLEAEPQVARVVKTDTDAEYLNFCQKYYQMSLLPLHKNYCLSQI